MFFEILGYVLGAIVAIAAAMVWSWIIFLVYLYREDLKIEDDYEEMLDHDESKR